MPVLGSNTPGAANTPAVTAAQFGTGPGGAAPPGALPGRPGAAPSVSQTWQKAVGELLYGSYAGQIGTYGLQGALGEQQLALSPQTLAVQEQNMVSGTGFNFANALLGYQGLGLQSQGLATQAATAAGQQGLEQAGFAITQQRFGQEQATAALQYKNKQLGLESQGAGTGTLNTTGSRTAQATASQEYAWQQATIYRQQQLSQLAQQSEQLGYQTKASGLAQGQQQLALNAQQQGLGVQQYASQLGFGLQQLGVKATPAALLSAISSAETGQATQLKALISQSSLIGGRGPHVTYATTPKAAVTPAQFGT